MCYLRRSFSLACCVVIQAVVLSACGGGATSTSTPAPTATGAPSATPTPAAQADLVPVPDASGSFCRFDNAGNATLTIKNQGTGGAGASRAEVKYNGQNASTTITADTTFSFGPIAAGQSLDKTVSLFSQPGERIPGTLTITVNLNNQVSESNTSNNTVSTQCS